MDHIILMIAAVTQSQRTWAIRKILYGKSRYSSNDHLDVHEVLARITQLGKNQTLDTLQKIYTRFDGK